MNVLRNSRGEEDITRIPKLNAIFLGESLRVMMDPKHILYEKVNKFFLQRPTLDFTDMPMFYSLSNSGEHYEQECDWLFNIMLAGLDDAMVILKPTLLTAGVDCFQTEACSGILPWSLSFSDGEV